jgi:hypothetical protein
MTNLRERSNLYGINFVVHINEFLTNLIHSLNFSK